MKGIKCKTVVVYNVSSLLYIGVIDSKNRLLVIKMILKRKKNEYLSLIHI